MSWIMLNDLVKVFSTCIEDERYRGPINAVSPKSVSNREFTKLLGRAIRRPVVFPLPAPVVKMMFGSMARETILSDLDVVPRRLIEHGFDWGYSDLETAFEELF